MEYLVFEHIDFDPIPVDDFVGLLLSRVGLLLDLSRLGSSLLRFVVIFKSGSHFWSLLVLGILADEIDNGSCIACVLIIALHAEALSAKAPWLVFGVTLAVTRRQVTRDGVGTRINIKEHLLAKEVLRLGEGEALCALLLHELDRRPLSERLEVAQLWQVGLHLQLWRLLDHLGEIFQRWWVAGHAPRTQRSLDLLVSGRACLAIVEDVSVIDDLRLHRRHQLLIDAQIAVPLILEDASAYHLAPEVLRVPAVRAEAARFGRSFSQFHMLRFEFFYLQLGHLQPCHRHRGHGLVTLEAWWSSIASL